MSVTSTLYALTGGRSHLSAVMHRYERVGIPSSQPLPINYRSTSWLTIGNFSQYLFVKDHSGSIAEKLGSGQPLRGIGVFGRIGYAPEETNTVTRDASVAFFANGLSDLRPNDSFGLGGYRNAISQPLKDAIAQLTGGTAIPKDENGLEIFYDFTITPAIRVIPCIPCSGVVRNRRRSSLAKSPDSTEGESERMQVADQIARKQLSLPLATYTVGGHAASR